MQEKRKYDWKVIVIIVALFVYCLGRINSLSIQNQNLSNEINNQVNELNSLKSQVNSIYANVDEQLKKEASMISGIDYSIGEFILDKTMVSLNLSVVPKIISDDMRVKVSICGNTANLEKNGNTFVGNIDVGMFILDEQYPLLTIETENETKTEFLENVRISYLFERILPHLKAGMSGRSSYSNGKLVSDMEFSLSYNNTSDVFFTSFTLIEEINGKEISREDITDVVRNAGSNYKVDYKKQFDIERENELLVYVLAEDSLGYVHKMRAWGWYQDKDGATAEAVMTMEHIYDKSGNLLYPVDSDLYE